MAELTLYSARICPFCHRSRLVLHEKGIDYREVEIDLKNKPQWYAEISPFGTVPALASGELRFWESSVINEYLEEVQPDPPMLPKEPERRALARVWIDFAGSRFVPPFYRLLTETEEEKWPERREALYEALRTMEQEGIGRLGGEGPFWLGGEVSLVDCAFYPWFARWAVLEHYRETSLPERLPRLERWISAMAARAAVRDTAEEDRFYIEGYGHYAAGRK